MAVNNRVKITNDIELKDRLVASLQSLLLVTKMVSSVGDWVKQVK